MEAWRARPPAVMRLRQPPPEALLAEYTQYIQDFLDRFNAVSGKPYEVSVSVGWVCQMLTPEDSLNDLTEEADARMYREKVRRKKQRQ